MHDRSTYGFLRIFFIILSLSYTQGCSTKQAMIGEGGIDESRSASPLDTNWQVIFLQHARLSNVTLESLDGNSLVVVDHGISKTVCVDSITELRLVKRSHFLDRTLAGAEIGALVGAVFAVLFVNPKSPFGVIEEKVFAAVFVGLETGIFGAFIGAFVDLVSSQDQILELSQVPPLQKPYLIGPFLENHGAVRPKRSLPEGVPSGKPDGAPR